MDKASGSTASDVDNIRKILFGEQVAQMDERFIQVETSINNLRKENQSLRQALEAETTAREQAFQELQSLLETTQKEWKLKQGEENSNQIELLTALQKALDLYRSRKK